MRVPPPFRQSVEMDDYENELSSQEVVNEYQPPADTDTFKQRNDPAPLLEKYRLQLLKAYKYQETTTDENGNVHKVWKVKIRKGTKPTANKQGVEDIINYVEKIINNHVVQGNIDSLNEYRTKMRFISIDVTTHFIAKRKDWNVSIGDIDILISNTVNLIDLFLTRTLFNEERKLYGVSYKETTNRDIKPVERKSMFQSIGSFLSGNEGGR